MNDAEQVCLNQLLATVDLQGEYMKAFRLSVEATLELMENGVVGTDTEMQKLLTQTVVDLHEILERSEGCTATAENCLGFFGYKGRRDSGECKVITYSTRRADGTPRSPNSRPQSGSRT